ncbi:MAG: solute carrier family 23 protein [Sporomusaceae bacterium]|nr:solute carrier family 23 protein [Sporomusaceae bacterium]
MRLRYQVNDRLPWRQNLLYGLQWLAIAVPMISIVGQVGGRIHYPADTQLQLAYIGKVFLVTGVTWLLQLLWGHKLPVIAGPATVLLLGVLANAAGGQDKAGAVYSAIAAGGLALAAVSATPLIRRLTSLFTPLVTGVVLLLIAFTLLPTVVNLISGGTDFSFERGLFSGGLLGLMLLAQRLLPRLLRSTLIIWALLAGSLAHYSLFNAPLPSMAAARLSSSIWTPAISLELDWGVLLSFLFCYLAVAANDAGSVQATAALTGTEDSRRIKRGLLVTGIGNLLAGVCGVIGPVNYSLSSGAIAASGCASRYSMLPAAAVMLLIACSPAVIQAFLLIPPAVTGTLLLYMLCSQIAGGLGLLTPYLQTFQQEAGMIVGVSLLLGTGIAFLPAAAAEAVPALWRPLLTNGFVVGVTAAVVLEKAWKRPPEK